MNKQPSFDDPAMGLVSSDRALVGRPTRELKEPLVPIDVPRLIETRLLVQANSGGGKTWANRRLLEQTYGMAQHIVIDPEGEMHTLREKFDYVLAAPKGGDCPADIKSAPLLARKLLELGASAIIDIYDLGPKRAEFVKLFLESLMNLPRDLWQPVMVLIEEAHKFCPERGEGEAVSTEAVKDLMTRGRKRGYCGILSTQRLSALHKSAAAECNNRLIGRTALDNDQERACKALGLNIRTARDVLKNLDDGHFFAFGPALCKQVTEIKIGANQTTHEKAGQRRKGPTPPRERVRQMLAQLADLPHEAEAEAKTVEALTAKVRELEKQVRAKPEIPEDNLQKIAPLVEENRKLRDRFVAAVRLANSMRASMDEIGAKLVGATPMHDIETCVEHEMAAKDRAQVPESGAPIGKRVLGRIPHIDMKTDMHGKPLNGTVTATQYVGPGIGEMSRLERALLTALVQYGVALTKRQILSYTGYRSSGDVSKAFARLVREGWATASKGTLAITEDGKAALGSWDALPTGGDLRASILASNKFSRLEKALFEVVCDAYPMDITKGAVLEKAGYSSSGDVSKAFAKLVTLGYFTKAGPARIKAAELLFDE